METVGIKVLKAQLSEYIARVRAGEAILITDRDEPVAELVPLSPARRKLMQLAREGKIRWNGGKPEGVKGLKVRGEPMSTTIVEGRR